MTRDLRHALRMILNNPGFSFAVIAVMALSIGACAAIFSVGKAVLFTRLPYSSPDRLVILWHTAGGNGAGIVGITFASVAALLTAISVLAVLVPALRATRVDPVVSLRYE